jgi:hypothetical protein
MMVNLDNIFSTEKFDKICCFLRKKNHQIFQIKKLKNKNFFGSHLARGI